MNAENVEMSEPLIGDKTAGDVWEEGVGNYLYHLTTCAVLRSDPTCWYCNNEFGGDA